MNSRKKYPPIPPDHELVFAWFKRHPKTGAIIRPKNGRPFAFIVKKK